MKRIMRNLSFWDLWLVCVAAGILTGTIWANLLGGELLGQIGYFDGLYFMGMVPKNEERRQLWKYVIRQRAWETAIGGLIAMTPMAVFAYLILAFGTGFATAAVISVFTLEKGWQGILYWLASVLPHGLCYLILVLVLTASVKEEKNRKKFRVWLLIGFLVTAGSFLESWVNPVLISACYNMLGM